MPDHHRGAVTVCPEFSRTMKRHKRRLPIPQHEFGFAPTTFNLMVEIGLDGERIARERAEADHARRNAEAAQTAFFTATRNDNE
jgi:hypothetical protein